MTFYIYGKRGTEKPIEIFVALFVILAVSLVMLKLFQGQVTQQQEELQTFQQEAKQQEFMQKATQYCKNKCNDAANDDCSLRSLATLCLAYGSDVIDPPEFMDLNLNHVQDTDSTLMAGVGICEDAVPCSAMVSKCCSQRITPSSCKSILSNYWSSIGFEPSKIDELFTNQWKAGTCNPAAATSSVMWWDLAEVDLS